MAEYIADFAPTNLPDIQYFRVDKEQAVSVEKAMLLAENQASFAVTLLPIDTEEQRRSAAEEWAGYKQAKGQVEARGRGAFLVVNGQDESLEALKRLLEDKDRDNEYIKVPYAPFVTHALAKIVKLDGTSTLRLFREYYDDPDL